MNRADLQQKFHLMENKFHKVKSKEHCPYEITILHCNSSRTYVVSEYLYCIS